LTFHFYLYLYWWWPANVNYTTIKMRNGLVVNL
jgi:hypothetical protein